MCDGVPYKENMLKCDCPDTPKCDGVPYKDETLECNGLTRQNAMASPIRKKRESVMVLHAIMRWRRLEI